MKGRVELRTTQGGTVAVDGLTVRDVDELAALISEIVRRDEGGLEVAPLRVKPTMAGRHIVFLIGALEEIRTVAQMADESGALRLERIAELASTAIRTPPPGWRGSS